MRRGVWSMVQCSQLMLLNPRSGTRVPPFRPQVPPCPGAAAGSASSAAVMASFFVIPIYCSPSRLIGCVSPAMSRLRLWILRSPPRGGAADTSARRLPQDDMLGALSTQHSALGTWHCRSEPHHPLLRRGVGARGVLAPDAGAVEGGEDAGGDGVVRVHPHQLVGGGAQHR